MFGILDELQAKLGAALRTLVLGGVSAAAGVAAVICLAVALFLWTERSYGMLEAWVVLGSVLSLVAVIGGIAAYVGLRRQARPEPKRERAGGSNTSAYLQDPRMLLVGLQVIRMIGLRRMLPLLVLGTVAAGFLIGRASEGADETEGVTEPAE